MKVGLTNSVSVFFPQNTY